MTRMTPILALGSALLMNVTPILAGDKVDFARDIQPIFAERCHRCHGAKRAEGGLRLDMRRRALLGGDTGPAIVVGEIKRGELLARVTSNDIDRRMPPGGTPLTD